MKGPKKKRDLILILILGAALLVASAIAAGRASHSGPANTLQHDIDRRP